MVENSKWTFQSQIGPICVVISVTCYAFALSVGKTLYNDHGDQKYQIMLLCNAIQSLLVGLSGFYTSIIPKRSNMIKEVTLAVIGATCFVLYQLSIYYFDNIGFLASLQSLLTFYCPFIAYFYIKEQPPQMSLWIPSAFICLGGVYIIIRPHESGFSSNDLLGCILCAIAILLHGLYMIFVRAWKPVALEVVFMQRSLLAIVLIPWSVSTEDWFEPTLWESCLIIAMGLGFIGGLGFQVIGFSKSNVTVASLIWNTKIAMDFIMQLIILRVSVDLYQALGIVVVFISVSAYKYFTTGAETTKTPVITEIELKPNQEEYDGTDI